MNMTDFHFLRPWALWLLMLLPLFYFYFRQRGQLAAWSQACDQHLMAFLTVKSGNKTRLNRKWIIMLAWALASIALAGPSWDKTVVPLASKRDNLVVMLDLSQSMMSSDMTPSRLERARYKLTDILASRREGETALLVFAANAFTVTPLTSDSNTIISLLPALETGIMPAQGSRIDRAIKLALELLEQANSGPAELLLITDSTPGDRELALASELGSKGHRLNVLAVGTPQGAPVSLPNGSFLKDEQGNIVIPKLSSQRLLKLAQTGGGHMSLLSADDSDIQALLNPPQDADDDTQSDKKRLFWQDMGFWLLPLLVPLSLAAFRKGFLILALIMVMPLPARAFSWDDLWQNRDQQAWQKLKQEASAEAALLADDPMLKGEAWYRAGEYQKALDAWSTIDNASSWYNRGNALAHLGQYEEGIAAYEKALAQQTEMPEAVKNKELLEKLLEQQKQDQQQQEQDQQNEQGDQEQEADPSSKNGEQNQDQQQEGQSSQNPDSEEDSQASDAQSQAQMSEAEQLEAEEKEAMEQWLRRIPDDPSGLLRRKFLYQYRQGKENDNEDKPW